MGVERRTEKTVLHTVMIQETSNEDVEVGDMKLKVEKNPVLRYECSCK